MVHVIVTTTKVCYSKGLGNDTRNDNGVAVLAAMPAAKPKLMFSVRTMHLLQLWKHCVLDIACVT